MSAGVWTIVPNLDHPGAVITVREFTREENAARFESPGFEPHVIELDHVLIFNYDDGRRSIFPLANIQEIHFAPASATSADADSKKAPNE